MDISGEGTSKGSNRLTQVYLENGCKSNACNCKRRVSYASYDDVVASAKEVLFSSAFLCLFVSGITQKTIRPISQNLVERRYVVHERNH